MYEFMGELQEQAFKELEPEAWDSITKRLTHLREGGGNMVARISSNIRLLLGRDGIEAEVNGREKKPYSIWRKMQERHIPFEQLSDVIAFRVIVDSVEACYRALGRSEERRVGKSVSIRVDLGGRRILKNKKLRHM